jgi:toxin-antitoxin system PIN domain toxin
LLLIDANLLVYAYHTQSAEHVASRQWLEAALSGTEPVRLAWVTIWAFLRISTNSRVFKRPLSPGEAGGAVAAWLDQPNVSVIEPAECHWDILRELVRKGQASGPLIMDAALAAIAIENGATLCTADRDFARFPGLKWINPLDQPMRR